MSVGIYPKFIALELILAGIWPNPVVVVHVVVVVRIAIRIHVTHVSVVTIEVVRRGSPPDKKRQNAT